MSYTPGFTLWFRFVMVHIWLPVFITSLPWSFENLWLGSKKSWKFLDDSQFASRPFPDSEKLYRVGLYIASIFGFNLLPHDICYVMYFNFFVIGPHLYSLRKTLTKPDVFNEINKYMYLHASHWDMI